MSIGPHLLGRIPSTPDSRDFKLVEWLATATADTLLRDKAIYELKQTSRGWVDARYPGAPPALGSHWDKGMGLLAAIGADRTWANTEPVLDQEDTPHCVGFDGAQWGNTLPIDDHYTNEDGHAIYYECKVLDGEPGAENGSMVRTLAKALQNRGRLKTYAFATSIIDIQVFVRAYGPLMIGSDWYAGMFNPDANGFIRPTGSLEGGHAFVLIGDHPSISAFEFLNSWGSGWGQNGRFKISYADFSKLLAADGEACAAVELKA